MHIIDSLLFTIEGFIGVCIVILTFFSSNVITQFNYNWIWFNPLYIIMSWFMFLKNKTKFGQITLIVSSVLSLAGIIFLLFQPGIRYLALLPLIMLIRTGSYIIKKLQIQKNI